MHQRVKCLARGEREHRLRQSYINIENEFLSPLHSFDPTNTLLIIISFLRL